MDKTCTWHSASEWLGRNGCLDMLGIYNVNNNGAGREMDSLKRAAVYIGNPMNNGGRGGIGCGRG